LQQALTVATVLGMARPLAIIQDEIRRLSVAEKEEILRTLLEELDGPPDPDVEAAWLEEAERRGREIDSGQVQCVPADEMFRKLDALLKK
jgi:putative addiction module component (TIGR02574 family)